MIWALENGPQDLRREEGAFAIALVRWGPPSWGTKVHCLPKMVWPGKSDVLSGRELRGMDKVLPILDPTRVRGKCVWRAEASRVWQLSRVMAWRPLSRLQLRLAPAFHGSHWIEEEQLCSNRGTRPWHLWQVGLCPGSRSSISLVTLRKTMQWAVWPLEAG